MFGIINRPNEGRGSNPRPGDPTVTAKTDNPFEEPIEIEVETAPADGPQPEGDAPATESEAVAAAQMEAAAMREAMLRMQAETDNTRKRLTRELERSRLLALEKILRDLLQVRDSLERGIDVDPAAATVESLLEGQKLTLKMLNKVMQDHHLEEIDPAGEAFDPSLHEAMTVLPSPEHDENTVIEVLQKGYRLHDRLIRPAMVVVSSKP